MTHPANPTPLSPVEREKEPKPTMCYTGTCSGCGSLTAAQVIDDDRKSLARFCAQVVRGGDVLGQASVEQVREKLAFCTCPKQPKKHAGQTSLLDSPHA
jgi:hypothetical protein